MLFIIISNKDVLTLLENSDRLFRILFGQTQIQVFLGKKKSVFPWIFIYTFFLGSVQLFIRLISTLYNAETDSDKYIVELKLMHWCADENFIHCLFPIWVPVSSLQASREVSNSSGWIIEAWWSNTWEHWRYKGFSFAAVPWIWGQISPTYNRRWSELFL